MEIFNVAVSKTRIERRNLKAAGKSELCPYVAVAKGREKWQRSRDVLINSQQQKKAEYPGTRRNLTPEPPAEGMLNIYPENDVFNLFN